METGPRIVLLLAIACSVSSAKPAVAQAVNLDFELPSVDDLWLPHGWTATDRGSDDMQLDRDVRYRGEYSFRLGSGHRLGYGAISQRVPAEPYLGSTVRVTGMVRADGVSGGHTGFWLSLDEESQQPLQVGKVAWENVTGSSDWTSFTIERMVPAGTRTIEFGAVMYGSHGTAWFDAIQLETAPQ